MNRAMTAGPFFSPDSRRIVYRAQRVHTPSKQSVIRRCWRRAWSNLDNWKYFVMNADGSDKHQVTANGASNFAPSFFPDGRHIVFSSNVETRGGDGRPSFHLYSIKDDGTGLERLTLRVTSTVFRCGHPMAKSWSGSQTVVPRLLESSTCFWLTGYHDGVGRWPE